MENEKEIKPERVQLVAGFLASAIDMEDEMSGAVYGDFLDRQKWPPFMDEDSFQNIKESLEVLIRDTEEHKRRFSELLDKLNKNQENAKNAE